MNGWEKDKRWSDRYLDEIKAILGVHLIGEPPVEEDQERNTDLTVLRMNPVRIGVRIRRKEYLERYAGEFTIRADRPNGHKTELAKIIEGWGDYFFYGFGGDEGLLRWALCDLNVFRTWFNRQLIRMDKGKYPGVLKTNHDNSSSLLAFSFSEMPDNFIIAKEEQCIAAS